MIEQGVQRPVREGVIPLKHLLFTGAAIVAVVATMVYLSYGSRAPNSGFDVAPASGGVSSRLASAPDQINVGGDVTVRVTWQGPEAGPVFNVAMDTHSVDLDPYDLGKMVVLHTNAGRESAVQSWDAPKGGHHRKGKLVFSEVALDGKPFIAADTDSIELVIYDLSGVPTRSFTWELK
jgi:hypothetical protein